MDIEGAFGSQLHKSQEAMEYREPAPIDMIIFCPSCHKQHIDRPEPHGKCLCGCLFAEHNYDDDPNGGWAAQRQRSMPMCCKNCRDKCSHFRPAWTNPTHTSHTCRTDDGGCGINFRLADVPTNGVKNIQTKGENDTWAIHVQCAGD